MGLEIGGNFDGGFAVGGGADFMSPECAKHAQTFRRSRDSHPRQECVVRGRRGVHGHLRIHLPIDDTMTKVGCKSNDNAHAIFIS